MAKYFAIASAAPMADEAARAPSKTRRGQAGGFGIPLHGARSAETRPLHDVRAAIKL